MRRILGVAHAQPAFAVPQGACDCHVHVFGPAGKYAYVAERTYMPSPASVDDLTALQEALGLSRVVIIQASPQGTDNTCLLEALSDLRDRGRAARGIAVVAMETTDDRLWQLHDGGVRGLRVNLESFGMNNPEAAATQLRETAARAALLGWHVQVYTNLRMIAQLQATLRALPVPVVIDHFGLARAAPGTQQEGFDALIGLVMDGNVYVKLSAPYRITSLPDHSDGERIVRPLIDANPERMLWGTDWPHTGAWPGKPRMRDAPEPFHPIDDGEQLNLLGKWATAQELRRILVENPGELYGF